MTLIYGKDEVTERMNKETMKNPVFVSINQKYVADVPADEKDNMKSAEKEQKEENDSRSNHAIGGVAKARLGYPHTDPISKGDQK